MILTKNNGGGYSSGDMANASETLRTADRDNVIVETKHQFLMDDNIENEVIIKWNTDFLYNNMRLIDVQIRQAYTLSELETEPDFEQLKETVKQSYSIQMKHFEEKNTEFRIPYEIKPLTSAKVQEVADELNEFLLAL